jgi:hypothetical protein
LSSSQRRSALAHRVDDDVVAVLVRDGEREAVVAGAARRVHERAVANVRRRGQFAQVGGGSLDGVKRHEALDVDAKLGQIFSGVASAVALQLSIQA